MVSTSLVSMIITNKTINSLPLYRQEQDFKREGINLTRQDMSNYVYQANDIVSSVVDKIKEYVINSEITRSDETPLNIINKDGKKLEGNTNSYVWILSSGRGYYPSPLYTLGSERGKEERINLLLHKCNELFSYIQEQYDKCLTKSSIGRDLSYALNCKDGFMNIFTDG